jgi:hypothetical protein
MRITRIGDLENTQDLYWILSENVNGRYQINDWILSKECEDIELIYL